MFFLFVNGNFIFIPTTLAATNKGTMTLNLSGVIDMNINPSEVQYINGDLSGVTSFTGNPVYSNSVANSWSSTFALISLSQYSTRCNSTFVEKIPSQSNKYGLKLSLNTNSNIFVYVTPILNYSVSLGNFNSNIFKRNYSGQFFKENPDLVDPISRGVNVCFSPTSGSAAVPAGGTKTVTITSPGSFPIYITSGLVPGILSYKGTPFFIGSFGSIDAGDYNLKVHVNANIMVKRSCSVTGISAQQFNENMTLTNEIIRDSLFTVSCGGKGNPVNVSATVTEGSYDSSQPTKLLLAPINGTVSKEKPWVLAQPYRQGQAPSLTCNDVGRSGLIKFDNTEVELSNVNMGNDIAENVGIKWALCKTPQVKAGDYRAKVDVSIFVRG